MVICQVKYTFFLAVGEWLLILPRPTSLTAGFAQPLRHIARASSSPMLPNTVLTRSQLGMAEPGFEPTTLCLDIWSGFELHFWPHKSAQLRTDPTYPLQLSLRLVRTLWLPARDYSPCKCPALYNIYTYSKIKTYANSLVTCHFCKILRYKPHNT